MQRWPERDHNNHKEPETPLYSQTPAFLQPTWQRKDHWPNWEAWVGKCNFSNRGPRVLAGLVLVCILCICIHVQPIRAHLGYNRKSSSWVLHTVSRRNIVSWRERGKTTEPDSWPAPCSGESGLIHSLEKKEDLQDRPVEDSWHVSLLPQAPGAPSSRSWPTYTGRWVGPCLNLHDLIPVLQTRICPSRCLQLQGHQRHQNHCPYCSSPDLLSAEFLCNQLVF